MQKRRYEMFLPLRYRDGRRVSPEKVQQMHTELLARSSAVWRDVQPVRGSWIHGGSRYEGESLRIFTDVDDTAENQEFFRNLKETLLAQFEQMTVYIASYPVDIL